MEKMKDKNIGLVLIQIEEAHTNKWPLGFIDHPENHKTFQHRVNRANEFKNKFNEFENVYVDTWNNDFENTYQAWPDKFVFIDKDMKVIKKSEYSMEALIIEDYSKIIENL